MNYEVMLALVIVCVQSSASAQTVEADGENLWSVEEAPEVKKNPSPPSPPKSSRGQPRPMRSEGNLPQEYRARTAVRLESTSSATILPPGNLKSVLKIVRVGEEVEARVLHSILAFPDERAPVIAVVEADGPLKGYRFVGESRLESNSKRVLLDFGRIAKDGRVYEFKGVGLSNRGQPGFEGEYHSREAAYFAGDFIASLTAAYFDGLVPRRTNVFGQVQEDNSVDSAFKKGLSAGAMSTAERFREKLKRVPEFCELRGPLQIKVLVLDVAKEK